MSQWRLPLILCLSIVFGAPVLKGLLQSDGDMLVSGLQYAAALGLAWLGVSTITRLVDGFDHANRERAHEQALAEARADAEAHAARPVAAAERPTTADGTDADRLRSDRAATQMT